MRLGVAKWKRSKCHHGFNPRILVELSATPAEGANVLGQILGSELNAEEMIKLGLHTHNKASSKWCDTICVFESETGDPAWRHWSAEMPDSRRSRDPVVRVRAVVGIHDYLLDWIFSQDGAIEVRVGTTGIVEVKAVETRDVMQAEPGADAYRRFVDRNVIAVCHDHCRNYRLDLDIDDADNRFVVDRLVTRRLPEEHPRRSL